MQNEIKSKVTIIGSLLKTQKALTNYLSDKILSPFSDRESQPIITAAASGPLSTPSLTPATISTKPITEHLQQSQEKIKLVLKKHSKFHHFGETILYTKINSIHYILVMCLTVLI